ncbi:MAG: metallophosphoesterase [Pseudomonadota bacterium]
MSIFFWGLAALLLALFIYGFWIEPAMRLRVVRRDVRIETWGDRAPLTILLVADLHAGAPHVSLGRVRRIVEEANALGADLTVLLGDYAAAHRFVFRLPAADEIIALLKDLRAPLGVWAVQGNHDWWDDPEAVETGRPTKTAQALTRHGLPELDNEAVRIGEGQNGFWLMGIADQRAFAVDPREDGLDDLDAAMEDVSDDAPAILIAHEPDIFPDVPEQVALTVSGHTHGGQVRIFGRAPVIDYVWCEDYTYGHYVHGDQHLIISAGIGCSKLPVRFGSPPELTLITVRGT